MDTNSTVLSVEQQAQFLHDSSAGVYLSASVGACLGNTISPPGFKAYLDQLLISAGDSAHPLTRMMWEQFAMGHHNLGRLYSRAAQSTTIDEMTAYSAIIVKLHAELRLLSETLHRLHKPGVAECPPCQHGQSKPAARPADFENSNTQLTSNEAGEPDEPNVIPFIEPASRRRRSPKSVAAARAF